MGINTLIIYLRPGEGCVCPCWELGSYQLVWKLSSATSFSLIWWTVNSLPWFPFMSYVWPLMKGPNISGCVFNLYILCHPELLTVGISHWLNDSFPRIWRKTQNRSQQCSEGSHQYTWFIMRIETYLLSLLLVQILVFIFSPKLLVGLFLPSSYHVIFCILFFTCYWWW